MFYELNSPDPLGKNSWKRSNENFANGSFEGQVNLYAKAVLFLKPDAVLMNPGDGSADTEDAEAAEIPALEDVQVNSFIENFLPDG